MSSESRERGRNNEAALRNIYERLAGIEAKLAERCQLRGQVLEQLDERVSELEAAEYRRKGGMALAAVLLAAAGTLGGIIAKALPLGTLGGR